MLSAGASFGELALLQKSATRTASIIVPPGVSANGGMRCPGQHSVSLIVWLGCGDLQGAQTDKWGGDSSVFDGVELVRITRECYDRTVNRIMSTQLKDMLKFLSEVCVWLWSGYSCSSLMVRRFPPLWAQVEPFKGLPKQHLSSLSVFVRAATYDRGSVVVSQGDVADRMYVIMEGDVRVLAEYDDDFEEQQVLPPVLLDRHTCRTRG